MAWVIFTKSISGKQPATNLGMPDAYWFTQTSAGRYDGSTGWGKDGTAPFTINVNESSFSDTIDGLTFTTQWNSSHNEVWINVGNSTYGSVTTNGGTNVNIGFFVNDDLQQARFAQIIDWRTGGRGSYLGSQTVQQQKNLYQWVQRNVDPEYTWQSLNTIKGIDRTLQLTAIKDEFINNAEAVTGAPRTNIEYYYEQSSIRQLMGGLGVGEEIRLVTTEEGGDEYLPTYKALFGGRDSMGDYYIRGDIHELENPAECYAVFGGGTEDIVSFLGVLIDREHEVATTTQISYSTFYNLTSYNQFGVMTSSEAYMKCLYRILSPVLPTEDEDEPEDEPYSDDDTGTGDNNYIDDGVPEDELPPSFCTEAGFVTLYAPNNSELRSISNFMWTSDQYDLDNFKKVFASPMDCIIGLNKLPIHIPTSSSKTLAVGNISTGISVGVADAQFVPITCGTVYIEKERNSFLDFAPYTKLEAYLPFCGTHPLNPDEYVGKYVTVKYRVDIMTGLCTALLMVGDKVIDSFTGNMSYTIPVSSMQYSSLSSASMGMIFGNDNGGVGGISGAINSAVNDWAQGKQHITKSGATGGNAGATSIKLPYFILTAPHVVNSENRRSYVGAPSYVTRKLSECSGYTQLEEVHVSSEVATDEELREIERMLKEGVIL